MGQFTSRTFSKLHVQITPNPYMIRDRYRIEYDLSSKSYILKGARYLLIIHEVLVAMDFFPAGVQTLEEESQKLVS